MIASAIPETMISWRSSSLRAAPREPPSFAVGIEALAAGRVPRCYGPGRSRSRPRWTPVPVTVVCPLPTRFLVVNAVGRCCSTRK